MQLFLSYSRKDIEGVDRLRNDLRDAGIETWIDKIGLTPGTVSWEQALRDAIRDADAVLLCASTASRESAYVRDEVALAKQTGRPIFPAWLAGDNWLDCVPLGLGGTQFADLRGDSYASGLLQLIAAIRGEDTAVAPLTIDTQLVPDTPVDFVPRNPYKGLRPFRSEDTGDFFGRDALIVKLLAVIADQERAARLLPVLGASGSGKSSVMMAGVLPRLQQAHPDWLFLDPIVPETHPLEKLTITLVRQLPNKSQASVREDLLDPSTRGLHRVANEISDKPVVLYIDQFEEIFTLVDDETARRQFIDLISTAVLEPYGVLYVMLSMRADFYDRTLQYTPLGKLIETHHVAIRPMTLADLYDVVQEPAELPDVRLNFDEGLVTEMVFAVREEASALPLLQFTLDRLFEQRSENTLTLQAYRDMGGIQGALAGHAETTYHNLASDLHRTLARALFLRLIEAGQTEQDTTRRRATYSELTLPDDEQTRILQETAAAFIDARLLVSDQSGETRTLEVSHETLIREWVRLAEWLREAREDLRLQRSLTADVAEWKRRGQPADMLYRGTILAEAQNWAERNTASHDETLFLAESERAESERQRRETVAARSWRYAVLAMTGVLVFTILGLSAILVRDNSELLSEASTAQADAVTAQAIARISEAEAEMAQNIAGTSEAEAAIFQIEAATIQNEVDLAQTEAVDVQFFEATLEARADSLEALALTSEFYLQTSIAAMSTAETGARMAETEAAVQEIAAETAWAFAIKGYNDGSTAEAVARTAEYQSEYVQAQVNWLSTRQFPMGPGELARTPAIAFLATATAQAELGQQQATVQVFPGVGDSGDFEMVRIPAGCFWMGSNSEGLAVSEICFESSFWIDKYEVTNAQYGSIGCEDTSSDPGQPRNCVNWFDARDFCLARDARLPSEAEWEYAARGPDSRLYPWGNEFDDANVVHEESGDTQIALVGSRPGGASWVGAQDMSGNIWEWTNSLYMEYPYHADDGRERDTGDATNVERVSRGGAFDWTKKSLFSAMRYGKDPQVSSASGGFRCVRTAE